MTLTAAAQRDSTTCLSGEAAATPPTAMSR